MSTHAISLYHNAFDNEPKPVSYTWEQIQRHMLPHEFRPEADKRTCIAWSPARYRPGVMRSNEGVIDLSVWVGDYDNEDPEVIAEVIALASARGWALLMHTTWSHAIKPFSARVLIPLAAPVAAADWPATWHAMNAALGGRSDPACTDPSRIYFGAYAPLGTEEHALSHVEPGEPASPPASTASPAPLAREAIPRDRLERFARFLTRKRDERAQHHGALLGKVADGSIFAEPGDIDNTIFALAQTLAEHFPEADPDSLAEHFSLSLDLMARRDPLYAMSPRDVAYKIKRAQQKIFEAHNALTNAQTNHQEQLIKDAFCSDRTTPYTPDEVLAIPAQRWVLQRGKSFYIRVGDTYRGPYLQEEAQNAAIRDLAPAITAGVDLYTITPQGEIQPKLLSRLVREYGCVIDRVIADIAAPRATYHEDTRTLIEAPAPQRDVSPVYHEPIDRWLTALGGERAAHLKAWIAHVTDLSEPCTALFLTGAKHLGKSVIAEGLAKLWNPEGQPTPLQDVLGTSFNASQLDCPLTFADEVLPTDFRGRVLYAELREFIQQRTRPLRRKFLPSSVIKGATRVIISANNPEVLATSESLSAHDIGAIADRILWIPCNAEAAEVIRDVDTSGWVRRDEIAEHALWLRDNIVWKKAARFIVQSGETRLYSRLVTGRGPRGAVLQFCVAYLLDPKLVDNHARGQLLIRVYKGNLLINVQALLACWDLYVQEKIPSTGVLSNAIAAMSTPQRPRLQAGNQRPNYRVIEEEHLIEWAEDKGFATPEQIRELLAIDTEERAKHLAAN